MAEAERSAGRAKILVVDDEDIVLDLFTEILSLDGYEIYKAKNADEALELIRNTRFHIIISDFRMPRVSGKEFYNRAKGIRPGIEKRFIFTSGEMDPVRKKNFIKETGVTVLSKPFRVEEVRTLIRSLLRELN